MHRTFSTIAFALALLVGNSTLGFITLVNNGLAPPEAENVIDQSYLGSESIDVENVGCNVSVEDPCAAPGAPTTVEVREGGSLAGCGQPSWGSSCTSREPALAVHESSTVEMVGGQLQSVYTFDSSTFAMSGGHITLVSDYGDAPIGLFADDSSTVTITGGSWGAVDWIEARGSSVVTIVGENFAVAGTPVDFGVLEGIVIAELTGTLKSGELIDTHICAAACGATGLVRLTPEPPDSFGSAFAVLSLAMLAIERGGARRR